MIKLFSVKEKQQQQQNKSSSSPDANTTNNNNNNNNNNSNSNSSSANKKKSSSSGNASLSPGELRIQKDISELNLSLEKTISIRFPKGSDHLLQFEMKLKPDEGFYKGTSLQ